MMLPPRAGRQARRRSPTPPNDPARSPLRFLSVTDTTLTERQQNRLLAAFRIAETNGLHLAAAGRLAALAVIAAWIAIIGRFPADYFYQANLAGFALLGFLQLWANRAESRRALLYALVLCDAALMCAVLILPNPLAPAARKIRDKH